MSRTRHCPCRAAAGSPTFHRTATRYTFWPPLDGECVAVGLYAEGLSGRESAPSPRRGTARRRLSRLGAPLLYLAGTHLSNGKCEVRFGIDVAPGPTGTITGPGTDGKCVDVDTNTSTSGNAVQLWTCNGASGQQWSVESDGTLRAFGKCLDIVGNGTANLTKVELWQCNGVGGQQWIPQANGSLLNPQSGRCLDDPQANTADGTKLQIYDCNGLFTQVWNVA